MVADNMGSKQLDAFLRNIDRNGVGALRKYYQRILTEQEGLTTPSFTSKSMDLVFNLGILLAAFPGAKVIHVSRHPLDVGLGCYKQYFAQGQAFSRSWEESLAIVRRSRS